MPGVLGVYTGADLAGYGTLKCIVPFKNRDGTTMKQAAAAGAADRQGALRRRSGRLRGRRDAAAGEGRRRSGRGRHRAAAGGDRAERRRARRRAAALRRRARQCRARLSLRRRREGRGRPSPRPRMSRGSSSSTTALVVNAMEPRAAVARLRRRRAAASRCIFRRQGVFGMSGNIAEILERRAQAGARPDRQCRRLVRHEGGAVYPEYVCVLHAARALGRPVKWTDERSGSFVSDSHGRDHEVTAELALDADGTFLARAAHRLRQCGRASSRRWRRCRRRSTRSRTCRASTARR